MVWVAGDARADRVLGSHGGIQIFVHTRTNFSEYGGEMNHSLGFPYSMYLRICVLVFASHVSRFNSFAVIIFAAA